MKKYTIKKIYHYTETVEVVAESQEDARDAAMDVDGESNNDETLWDCEIIDEEDVDE